MINKILYVISSISLVIVMIMICLSIINLIMPMSWYDAVFPYAISSLWIWLLCIYFILYLRGRKRRKVEENHKNERH